MLNLNLRKRKKLSCRLPEQPRERKEVEPDQYTKCKGCGETIKTKDLIKNTYVCPECEFHFKMPMEARITSCVGKFTPLFENIDSVNPLSFPSYEQKIKNYKERSGETEAVTVGLAKYDKTPAIVCIMNPNFMMGSMGSVVGERITLAFEHATKEKLPIVVFTASGGARMQEGLFSLMQMAKTAAAVKKHSDQGLFYLTVLTNPTTGGVSASFAMLGDVQIAEPGALVGFAGPRVIQQTTRQTLPKGFQSAEFVQEKGFIDMIVHRKKLKKTVEKLVSMHHIETIAKANKGGSK